MPAKDLLSQFVRQSFSSHDGEQISFVTHGSPNCRAIFLLHGFRNSADSWFLKGKLYASGLALDLEKAGYFVVAPDLRGHGKSAQPANASKYTSEQELHDVVALSNHLGVKAYAVVGYSHGSIEAAKLLTIDRRLACAVLGGIGDKLADKDWRVPMELALELEKQATSQRGDASRRSLALAGVQRGQSVTTPAELAGICVPVLCINGRRDDINGSKEGLSRLIPGSELAWVAGDHATAPMEAEFVERIVSFFAASFPSDVELQGVDVIGGGTPSCGDQVRILHISDTHNLHRTIEERFPFPSADVLIHTGDFSDNGTDDEIADFTSWLRSISDRFCNVVIIPGNHDWRDIFRQVQDGVLAASDAIAPGFMKRKLHQCCPGGLPSNCQVLDHNEITVKGIRIWGSAWVPWSAGGSPDHLGSKEGQLQLFEAWADSGGKAKHRFGEIPAGVDVLLTHGPAKGLMDCIGRPGRGWGSSEAMSASIYRARPRVHLFGHLHEQRGQWCKTRAGFEGGIEYSVSPGQDPFVTNGPPRNDYPCELISCNAMANHPKLEGKSAFIAGPARLIIVKPQLASEVVPEAASREEGTPVSLCSIGSRLYLQSIGLDVANSGRELFQKPSSLSSHFTL